MNRKKSEDARLHIANKKAPFGAFLFVNVRPAWA
jgi:hypothetical protein